MTPSQPQNNGAAIRQFVPGSNIRPDPKWYIGLDLGQRRDHTALAAVLLTWNHLGPCKVTYAQRYQPELKLLRIERFPLGMAYENLPGIIRPRLAACDRTRQTPSKELILDAGGPGPPVVENLRRMNIPDLRIRPVMITSGSSGVAALIRLRTSSVSRVISGILSTWRNRWKRIPFLERMANRIFWNVVRRLKVLVI